MPTNLPPEAMNAKKEFEEASTTSERMKKLDRYMKLIPKHKGTEKLLSNLKRKMKKLKQEAEKRQAVSRHSIDVKKSGAAQVCLLGFPNSGKSFLLNKLTNASIDSTPVPYETSEPEVGMHEYKGAKLQLVEIPSTSRGIEPELLAIVRNCDFVVIVARRQGNAERVAQYLEDANIKLNTEPKRIKVVKRPKGGIVVTGGEHFSGDLRSLKRLVQSSGVHNADVMFYEDTTLQDVRDFLEESTVYKGCIVFATNDVETEFETVSDPHQMVERIWRELDLVRVYTKEPGRERSEEPVVVEAGSTVEDVGRRIHKDFVKKFRFARVWGESAKFDSQMVGLSHQVDDGDVVEFHLK